MMNSNFSLFLIQTCAGEKNKQIWYYMQVEGGVRALEYWSDLAIKLQV